VPDFNHPQVVYKNSKNLTTFNNFVLTTNRKENLEDHKFSPEQEEEYFQSFYLHDINVPETSPKRKPNGKYDIDYEFLNNLCKE